MTERTQPLSEVPEDRRRLLTLMADITVSAKESATDPKNTAKGSSWLRYDWQTLGEWHDAEYREMHQEIRKCLSGLDGDPVREAGDLLLVIAMQVDRALRARERRA